MSELKKLAASNREVSEELANFLGDLLFASYNEDDDAITVQMSPLTQSIISSSIIFFLRDLANDDGTVFKMITSIGTHIQLESLKQAEMVDDVNEELSALEKQMDNLKHIMSAKSLINKIKNPDLN